MNGVRREAQKLLGILAVDSQDPDVRSGCAPENNARLIRGQGRAPKRVVDEFTQFARGNGKDPDSGAVFRTRRSADEELGSILEPGKAGSTKTVVWWRRNHAGLARIDPAQMDAAEIPVRDCFSVW